MIVIIKKLNVTGMAIWPFIILKRKELRGNEKLMNHELIHHKQQLELLILPFYVLYFLNYLFNLLKYKDHCAAYENIVFEKEAYQNDSNLNYLKERKNYNWLSYLKNS